MSATAAGSNARPSTTPIASALGCRGGVASVGHLNFRQSALFQPCSFSAARCNPTPPDAFNHCDPRGRLTNQEQTMDEDRVEGVGHQAKGSIKEAAGKVT